MFLLIKHLKPSDRNGALLAATTIQQIQDQKNQLTFQNNALIDIENLRSFRVLFKFPGVQPLCISLDLDFISCKQELFSKNK